MWFDHASRQYVAGIMEEDDPLHPEHQLIKAPAGPGRSFTLYLYDREKNHTIVRRLALAQMASPSLNPFIEVSATGARPAHSAASANDVSRSAKPVVQPDDLVVAGPENLIGPPPNAEYLGLRTAVTTLPQPLLDQLCGHDLSKATPFELNTLAAVRVVVVV